MNKIKYFFFSLVTGLLLCFSASSMVSAQTLSSDYKIHQDKLTLKNKWGTNVDIFFANLNTGATYNDIKDIINEDPNALSYTIYEVSDVKNSGSSPSTNITLAPKAWNPPLGSTHKYETTKTVTVASRAVKDDFVISVAKGQTVTLKNEYSGTLKGSISGNYFNKANLGINLSVTCKYSVTYKFTGPTSSNANSREYRVKYFREDGNYVQKDYCYESNGNLYGVRSHGGTYQEAVKYMSYSKDYKL